MATKTASRKKKPDVSGKAAVQAHIKYEIKVKCKTRSYYDDYDKSAWTNEVLQVNQIGNDITFKPESCETQIGTTLATLKAVVAELEKKVTIE